MVIKSILGAACTFITVVSFNANAAYIDRGGGLIYDEAQDITWTQNANLVGVDDYWDNQNAWAENLIYGGYDDWRLASNGEFYYQERSQGLFYGVKSVYWTGTEGCSVPFLCEVLGYLDGAERVFGSEGTWTADFHLKTEVRGSAWAVRDGDVVPIPPSVWLFASGLIGLIGLARRKKL